MDFFRIECFLRVAEAGNMTRAADSLNITQPAVSFQIRELEKELHISLFHRSRNKISLTPAGEVLRAGFVRLLDDYHALLEDARACAIGKPCLTIGYMGPINWAGISRFIGDFSARHPDIEVAVFQQQWKELADYLELGILDAAFLETSELTNRKNLTSISLFSDRASFAIAPDHPLAEKEIVTLTDLAGQTILLNNHSSVSMDNMLIRLQNAGIQKENFRFTDQTESSLTMAAAGQGLAAVPRSFQIENSALHYADFSTEHFTMEHSLAWLQNSESEALRLFIEAVSSASWPYSGG